MKNVADVYALTPLQELMLARARTSGQQSPFVEQFHCTLRGPLDAAKLKTAADAIVARHPLLRACFAWQGLKKPLQVVHQRVNVEWNELDWRDLATDQSDRRAALLRQDRARGFDLTRAPLTRFSLARMAEETWLFVFTCHHLVADGWSLGVVLREIFASYAQLNRMGSVDLPPPGAFGDYLAWLNAQDAVAADQFWKSRLGDYVQPTRLPRRCHANGQSATAGASTRAAWDATVGLSASEKNRQISTELTAVLGSLAQAQRVSLATLVKAAWTVLLAHHCETMDILFGVAVSGRPAAIPRVESIVGPLMNTLPLRIRIRWDMPLAELLDQLQRWQVESQPYEYCSTEQALRAAGYPRASRPFDTLLVVENYPLGDRSRHRIGDLEIGDVQGTTSAAYPVSLVVLPGNPLALRLMHDSAAISEQTAGRLLDQVLILLCEMAEKPHSRLKALDLIDAESRRQLHAVARAGCARVLDATWRPAPFDVPGEVWRIAGPPAHDSSRIADPCDPCGRGLLQATGFRGVLHPDGAIECLGRNDSTVRIGGRAVDPREVALVLGLHSLVQQTTVLARSDPGSEPYLVAYVLPAAERQTAIDHAGHGLLINQLQLFATGRLPRQMVPRAWRVLEPSSLDQNGQIDAARLPDAFRPRGETSQPYLPPRDPLEARLCDIWSEMLGVQPVGVQDNFLELGGYSSLAVALAARIEDEFGRRPALAALLEEPTVGHLAQLLRRDADSSGSTFLVPLRPRGSRPPLFCVHPAGGTVFCYLALAKHLDGDIPLFGLQAQGIEGALAPHDSVVSMASDYCRAIQKVQPSGPYRLCGWSTGGIIAFEIARQLVSQGEEAPVVALIDAAIPRPGETFDQRNLMALLALLFPGDDPDQLQSLQSLDRDQQLEHFCRRAERAQLLFSGAEQSQVRQIYDVFQANMKAVAEYQPRMFPGRLIVIRGDQQTTPMHEDRRLGWEPWATGGIELHELRTSHLAMLQEPAVRDVARILEGCLHAGDATGTNRGDELTTKGMQCAKAISCQDEF